MEKGKLHSVLKKRVIKTSSGISTLRLRKTPKRNKERKTGATAKILKEISRSCNTCERLESQPTGFKTTLHTYSDVKFGDEVSLDLMFIEGKALLHIVDTATRFSLAVFLESHKKTNRKNCWWIMVGLLLNMVHPLHRFLDPYKNWFWIRLNFTKMEKSGRIA